MDASRRNFLKLLITATGGSLIGYGTFRYLATRFPNQVWELSDWLITPDLDQTSTGPVSEAILQTLTVAVQSLLGMSLETTSHYADYFRWYAENRPGYKALYERFVATLDQSSEKLAGCNFINCDTSTHNKILEKAFQVRVSTSRIERMRTNVFDRDWVLFDKYIVREIFNLFAKTDALILLGYDSWPGTPRGLDGYTELPSRAN